MKLTAIAVLLYGLLVLVGGIIGYFKANSLPSLICGGVFGALLLVAGGMLFKELMMGWMIAVGASVCLVAFFGWRFYLSHAIWPPGIMGALSLALLVLLVLRRG